MHPEEQIFEILSNRSLTLATAESCTGGLIAHRITNVPGSSATFLAGVVTYSNESKIDLLGVSQDDLESVGAVSSEVAEQMAQGVRERQGSDVGLATTGIAGPSGGTPEKPVGTVYMAVATSEEVTVQHHLFTGDRESIKIQTAEAALQLMLQALEPMPESPS